MYSSDKSSPPKQQAEVAVWRFRKAGKKQLQIETPKFVGMTWGDVAKAIGESRLRLMNSKSIVPNDAIVTDQYPRAETMVYPGTSIIFATKDSHDTLSRFKEEDSPK